MGANVQKLVPQPTPSKYAPKIWYLQSLQKGKQDQKFQELFNFFRKLSANIPFVEGLVQICNHSKFMKQILWKKKKLK